MITRFECLQDALDFNFRINLCLKITLRWKVLNNISIMLPLFSMVYRISNFLGLRKYKRVGT